MEVYRNKAGNISVLLPRCAHCGSENVLSYDVKSKICVDCHRRYNNYLYRKRILTRDSRETTLHNQLNAVKYYMALRDEGITYKIPRDLDNELERVEAFIDNAIVDESGECIIPTTIAEELPIASKYVYYDEAVTCEMCGELIEEGYATQHGPTCFNCYHELQRFNDLKQHVSTPEECKELKGMIDDYEWRAERGWWIPSLDKAKGMLR